MKINQTIIIITASLLGSLITSTQASANEYWQSDGYGYVIEQTQQGLTFYDVTDFTCVKNQSLTEEFNAELQDVRVQPLSENRAELNFYALHPIKLKAISTLPKDCLKLGAFSAVDVFDTYWWTYAEHFPYSKQKRWNWQLEYPQWRANINKDTSEAQLVEIFANILNELRDGHADLVDSDGEDLVEMNARQLHYEWRLRQAWKEDDNYDRFWPYLRDVHHKWRRVIEQGYIKPNSMSRYFDNFHFGLLDNDLTYLRIESMADFTEQGKYQTWLKATDEAMQAIVPELNKHKGLVIDLRMNGGGTDLVSMALLSYFFDKDTQVGSEAVLNSASAAEPMKIEVKANPTLNYLGPIVVLLSEETASAAEIMLLGLAAREDVVFLGEPSNGSFSDILPKQLTNGWGFGLSHQIYYDAQGIDREEVGFPVQEYFPFKDLAAIKDNKDPALARAISLLSTDKQ